MKMKLIFLRLLFIVIFITTIDTNDPRIKDPNYHVATSSQMTITKEDESLVFGSDSGDSYRVESRTKDGEVRGVCGYILPDGSSKTVAYSAGIEGYKTRPLETIMPNGLAPFPHDLDGEEDKEINSATASPDLANAKSYKSSGSVWLKSFSNYIKHTNGGDQLKDSLIKEKGWFWNQPKLMKKYVETNDESLEDSIFGILSFLRFLEVSENNIEI